MERDATREMGVPRTLIVSYSGLLGGAERVLLDCATRLSSPVVVACPEGPLAVAVRAAGLEHARVAERPLRVGLAHARGIVALSREIAALTTGRESRALVAWGARAVLAAALLRRRPPLLAVHHDLPARRGAGSAIRWATRRADGVAAASQAVADAVAGPRATILHPGVDLDRFAPAPAPDEPPHALVLGALVPWKRPDLALEVAARVPGLQLELAGAPIPGDDAAYVQALQARAAHDDLAGRVTFLGAVDDPRPALARSHCLLHCADAEPWGLALVEALASGRPVVAANAGGPREIVADGAGRLFPPGDADAAAVALEAVLHDPAAHAAARLRAQRFGVDASSARFAEALERVAGS
jgi:glycosyltransferase involved in cell wall biosynthesis